MPYLGKCWHCLKNWAIPGGSWTGFEPRVYGSQNQLNCNNCPSLTLFCFINRKLQKGPISKEMLSIFVSFNSRCWMLTSTILFSKKVLENLNIFSFFWRGRDLLRKETLETGVFSPFNYVKARPCQRSLRWRFLIVADSDLHSAKSLNMYVLLYPVVNLINILRYQLMTLELYWLENSLNCDSGVVIYEH